MSLLLQPSYAFPEEISAVIGQKTEKEDADERLYISIETEILRIQSMVNDHDKFLQNAINTTDTSALEWDKHLETLRINYRNTITDLLQKLPYGQGSKAFLCPHSGKLFFDDPYGAPSQHSMESKITTLQSQ